jgi:hypothetical protein
VTTPPPPSTPGDPPPWSYPHETGFSAPTPDVPAPGVPAPDMLAPDVLASPAEQARQNRSRRRTPLILTAVATAVALVLGGGAYAGVRLWNGSGAQPEEATPSSVLAFARLDLSPGYGQKLKINNLLKKFPKQSGKDAADELTEGVFDALGVDEAAYRKNVEPWFADRIGAAVWLDDTNRPYGLIVLAVDDESAARRGLTELQHKDGAEEFGFGVRDGFALVARGDEDAQAAADAAADDAARESLAASARFRDDVDWLPDRQAALAWADLGKLKDAMTSVLQTVLGAGGEDLLPPSMFGSTALLPGTSGGALDALKGRMVVGAQATDNGVEIRFRGYGMDSPALAAAADARSTVDSLPANSVVAAAARAGDLSGSLDGILPDFDAMLPEDVLKDMPPGAADELRQQLAKSRQQYEAIGKAYSSISGAKISVAMSKMDEPVPALAATAEATSPEKAKALADAAKLLGDDVTVSTSGTKVELKTKGYAADGGKLGGEALYREALRGAPEDATAVVYLDVQRLIADSDMSDQERREAKAFKAVGIATGTEDGDSVGLIRLVIK